LRGAAGDLAAGDASQPVGPDPGSAV
jgi:hypothetical protein